MLAPILYDLKTYPFHFSAIGLRTVFKFTDFLISTNSYKSISGILYDEQIIAEIDSNPPPSWSLATLLDALPSYKTLMNLLGYNL